MPDVAVDNDVLIKAACYGLTTELDASRSLGVLGAARYVVAKRIERDRAFWRPRFGAECRARAHRPQRGTRAHGR